MSAWAVPGAKCVCVDDEGFDVAIRYGMKAPVVGEIYTIREVRTYPYAIGVMVAEIVNPTARWGNDVSEATWDVLSFRPLVTKTQEQDVQMFLSLLEPAGVDA